MDYFWSVSCKDFYIIYDQLEIITEFNLFYSLLSFIIHYTLLCLSMKTEVWTIPAVFPFLLLVFK